MRCSTLLTGMALAALALPVSGQQVRSNLGTLTCTVASAMAPERKPDSEQRPLRCTYRPTGDGAEQTYAGTIAKVGEAGLPAGKIVLIWVVNGPAGADLSPGFLAQSYVGRPVGDASERTAVVLAGQRDSNLVLQSSTPTGDPGSDATMILDLSLSSTPT